MRTVSLFPSATELVTAIGATDSLVGRSHRCNHPEDIQDLPIVTESKLNQRASSDAKDIDAVVDDHHHGEHSYFRVVTEDLRDLQPDVLVTQSLCEVCAVPESMTAESMEKLEGEPELVSVGPTTIGEILETIDRLGGTLGYESGANELGTSLQNRIDDVVRELPAVSDPAHVVCLEWTDALRCHGLWVPEIIDLLGAKVGFGSPGEHGKVIDWGDVVAYDPDVLIVSPCGRTIPEIRQDMEHLIDRPGWQHLTAVEKDRVYLVDGELSSRHGPRVVRTLEVIAKILYPETYDHISWEADEVAHFRAV